MWPVHRIWQVCLVTNALGGHAYSDTSRVVQSSPAILRSIPSSDPEVVSVPPSPATTTTSTCTWTTPPPPSYAPVQPPTKPVLLTSEIFVTSHVGSVSAPRDSTATSPPAGTVMPFYLSSSSLQSESSLSFSASSAPSSTLNPTQTSSARLSSSAVASSNIISSFTLPSSSRGAAKSIPSGEISSQMTSGTPTVTSLQITSAFPPSAHSSSMALQAGEIPPVPSMASGSGSYTASRGKEKVWWVAFLVPAFLMGL